MVTEGGSRVFLNELDRACEARGVSGLGADAAVLRCFDGLQRRSFNADAPHSLAPAAVSPEDAARAARCAAKAAEVERLHVELAAAERERLAELAALEADRLALRAEVAALAALLGSEGCEGVELAANVTTSKGVAAA